MKNFFSFIVLSLFPFFVVSEPLNYTPKGDSVLLINAESGSILFEKNSTIPRFPASTTKVATALYALKIAREKMDHQVTIESFPLVFMSEEQKKRCNYHKVSHCLEKGGSSVKLQPGEVFSMKDLLKGMLISSGNDAANVIAHHLSGDIPSFMQQMNQYLQEIGCKNTCFCNPHGLHDPSHVTTAWDLSLIFREALSFSEFRDTIKETRFIRPKTTKQPEMLCLQTNRLMRAGPFFYSKAIGGKTGYHSRAKKTFVGAAQFQGRTLIVVLLGYSDSSVLFKEAVELFEMAFNQPKVRKVFLKAGPQPFTTLLDKNKKQLKTYLDQDIHLDYYPAEDPQAKCYLVWNSLKLPIRKGEKVGEIRLMAKNGALLDVKSLLAAEEISLSWYEKMEWKFVFSVIFIFLFLFILFKIYLKK